MRFRTTLVLALILAVVIVLIRGFNGGGRTGGEGRVQPLFPGFEAATVDRITLTMYLGRKAELVRVPGGRWEIRTPFRDDARPSAVDQVLEMLARNQRIPVPLDPGTRNLDAKGLDPPEYALTFHDGRGSHTLWVGARDPFRNECYVMIEGEDLLFRTGSNLRNFLEQNPENLRDDRIFRLDPLLVTGVTLEGPEGLILQAEKRTLLWEITAPWRMDADSGRIQNLVSRLAALRIQARLEERGDDPQVRAAYGLDGPCYTVTLRCGPVARKAVFEAMGRGPGGDHACVREGEKRIVSVNGPDFSRILATFRRNYFRSLELLPPVRNRLQILRIRRAGRLAMELRRTSDGKYFRFTHPFKAPADNIPDGNETPVYRFLVHVDGIRVEGHEEGFVADGVDDLKPYGLDPPDLEVELRWKEESVAKSARLLFSRDDGSGRVYATRKGLPGPVCVFRVRARDLAPLRQDPVLLRDRRVFPQKIERIRAATFRWKDRSYTIRRNREGYFAEDPESRFQQFLNRMKRTLVIRYVPGGGGEGDPNFSEIPGAVRIELGRGAEEGRTVLYEIGRRGEEGWPGRTSDLPQCRFLLEDGFVEEFRGLFEGLK